ncbi:MAG: DUF2207 domain-containing protein [Acidobacteriota bacterium]|nr:DUF2207 domain-containing protein [Acidobacteriota bacterium]
MRAIRVLLVVAIASSAFAQGARSLYWRAIDVDARLDRDGKLHVLERQSIVFNGDWNGGERSFKVRGNQRLEVNRVMRIEDGREIPLTRGDLTAVDHWDTTSSNVVRWRSRRPSDPPFANRELTYLLDYTYSNVLVPDDGNHFMLDHDFGFADRSGVVQRFHLRLTFDPIWGADTPIEIVRTDLRPGDGVPVTRELTYGGAGQPAGIDRPITWRILLAALAFFGLCFWLLLSNFLSAEESVQRFAPVVSRFDHALLSLPPEVAGAAWDESVGAPEVAAMLARMTQEGKLTTRIEGDTLYLHLNAQRDSLPPYERRLISALFYDGGDDTDTESIRSHYAGSGFDPATTISSGITKQLERLPDWNVTRKRYSIWLDILLLFAAAAFLLFAGATHESDRVAAITCAAITLFFSFCACFAAVRSSNVITSVSAALTTPLLLMTLASLPFLAACITAQRAGLHAPVLYAAASWILTWLNLVLDLLCIRETPAKIAYRKRIAGARQFLVERLQLPQPAFRDDQFPYVVAFGLNPQVDHWFRPFSEAGNSTGPDSDRFLPDDHSPSSVSDPSPSSSSPSSTDGGSSSSGGGGGGGW